MPLDPPTNITKNHPAIAASRALVEAWDRLIADRLGVEMGVLGKSKRRDLQRWGDVCDAAVKAGVALGEIK